VYEWLGTGFRLVIGFIEHLQIVTTRNYSAIAISHICSSLQDVLHPLSLLCLHQWMFPAPGPTSLKASGHLTPTSYSSFCRLKTPSRRIASARTAQKTPLLTVTSLLRVTKPLLNSGCFSGPTVLVLSKYATTWTFWTIYVLVRPHACPIFTETYFQFKYFTIDKRVDK
jgi:hypothetical protein